jgi:hypothetical protein
MKTTRFEIRQVNDHQWLAQMYDPNIDVPHRYYVVFDKLTGHSRRNKFESKAAAKAWILKKERK